MIYLILGRREMGKTTLAFYMAQRCPRRVIFDPRCQFDGRSISGSLEIQDAMTNLIEQPGEVLIAPKLSPQGSFDSLASQIRAWPADTDDALAVLLDEATFYDAMQSQDFEWVVRAAPRRQVHLIFTAHRPVDIDINIRALADEWLLFKTVQENDLKVITERCGVLVADQASILPPYWFLQWDDAHGEAYKHPPLKDFQRISAERRRDGVPSLDVGRGNSMTPKKLF